MDEITERLEYLEDFLDELLERIERLEGAFLEEFDAEDVDAEDE